jgi:hypothetical protein
LNVQDGLFYGHESLRAIFREIREIREIGKIGNGETQKLGNGEIGKLGKWIMEKQKTAQTAIGLRCRG